MVSGWSFIISGDLADLQSYYIYSMLIAMLHNDVLMILHHTLVLYAIYRVETPDRVLAMTLLRYAKISDVVAHVNKICYYINTSGNLIIEHIRLLSILITIVLWFIFRVCYIIYTVRTIQTYEAMIAISLFAGFTVWWMGKLGMLAIKLM